jgi:Uma2 family endonuclease
VSIDKTDSLLRDRITVGEYYRMAEDGLLDPDVRLELIEGEMVVREPMGSPHAGTANDLMYLLMHSLGSSAQVRVQMPVHLDDYSEPEPDLAVVLPQKDFYRVRHPTSADVILLVEVGQSSVGRDRKTKVPLYARHGVPEVWLVDLVRGQLHFYRSPRDDGYASISFTTTPGFTSLSALQNLTIDLSGLFGR